MPRITCDYIIVGSGLTGSVIARELVDAGREVLVLERRSHLGGNVHDDNHACGVRIHTYGPHHFRTNSSAIWEFVNRFASFYDFFLPIQSWVNGRYENWPLTKEFIVKKVGPDWKPAYRGVPHNFEEAALTMMPREIYELFVKGYTEKQWGVPAHTLSTSLARRLVIRQQKDPRLFPHTHQGIPRQGYAAFMKKMLVGIPIEMNCDYLKKREQYVSKEKLIFTGPIDEFFGFDLGRLIYRGQERVHQYFPDIDKYLPIFQVNYPTWEKETCLRQIEWKQMMPPDQVSSVRGTVVTSETSMTPNNPDQYEYPFPEEKNHKLYHRYRARAQGMPGVLFCGRLGEYQYYDMDHAIERALSHAKEILKKA